jgi:hypothetical protein
MKKRIRTKRLLVSFYIGQVTEMEDHHVWFQRGMGKIYQSSLKI